MLQQQFSFEKTPRVSTCKNKIF
ncbi:hypothetical protein B4U80_11042 [Leptotrombidium deliense]|uniref:Uncharacterized protein n=1 Tax=Leptotrombidium deliense TaxID=299467 RepID=A0A443SI83_9ACAR|nr:hypothetical protein B4U80_11042 [Leptotrombidium deliense]